MPDKSEECPLGRMTRCSQIIPIKEILDQNSEPCEKISTILYEHTHREELRVLDYKYGFYYALGAVVCSGGVFVAREARLFAPAAPPDDILSRVVFALPSVIALYLGTFAIALGILWIIYNYAKSLRSVEMRIFCIMTGNSVKTIVLEVFLMMVFTPIMFPIVGNPNFNIQDPFWLALLVLFGMPMIVMVFYVVVIRSFDSERTLKNGQNTWNAMRIEYLVVDQNHGDLNNHISNQLTSSATRYYRLSQRTGMAIGYFLVLSFSLILSSTVFPGSLSDHGVILAIETLFVSMLLLTLLQPYRYRNRECEGAIKEISRLVGVILDTEVRSS